MNARTQNAHGIKTTTRLALLAGFAGMAAVASAQVYSSSPNLEIPIADSFPLISDTIHVSGGPASIADLNVNLQIQHEYDEDVHAVLQTPNGYISLTTSNGFGQDYITTRFDDSASLSITQGASPYDGDFRPEGILNQWAEYDPTSAGFFFGPNYARLRDLNGQAADGDYTLYIEDFDSLYFSGTLLYWSLEFNYASDPNNPRPAPAAPTAPQAKAAINYLAFTPGQTARFTVEVTPAYLPTPSTGISVSVDASALGLGTLTLLDDGNHGDGVAGDGIFGASGVVNAPLGSASVSYTVSDAQGRSTNGSFPAISIIGPGPGCTDYQQPQSFSDLAAAGGWTQDPANGTAPLSFSGFDQITDLHLSGRLVGGGVGSSPDEAGIAVYLADGTAELFTIVPDVNDPNFLYTDVTDARLTFFQPHAAGDIVGIETYDNYENPGIDETWQTMCLSYEARNLPPVMNFAYDDPIYADAGGQGYAYASVRTGVNPYSTNLTVSVDLSPLGGGSAFLYDDGAHNDGDAEDGYYAGPLDIPANAPPGSYELTATVSDDQGRSDSTSFTFTVTAPVQWDELANGGGDAGQLPGSELPVSGSGTLSSMSGFLDLDDTDMYRIQICDPTNFVADADDPRTQFDTQMWLFKTDGTGVEFNDDGPNGSRSYLDGTFVTDPGEYLLAITNYDRDALDQNGDLIWENTPFITVRPPDGPGAANPVTSWGGFTFGTGVYVIHLQGACFVGGAACDPDVNQDGVADQGDVDYLINVIAGGENPTGINPDFNQDGVADQGDIDALINVVAGGPCP
ncbi:MAG: hypothetical protein GC200_07780 [Tepidisphaera sp.]|nr:hypothetical protein [Tepidisphaera sp.]